MLFLAVTPDKDEAQRWVFDELAKPEYSDELTPLTRFIRRILQWIADALEGGGTPPPLEFWLLIGFALAVIVAVAIVLFNPVRLARHRKSGAVFDGEAVSLLQAQQHLALAIQAKEWDNALVWAFRILVLSLAERGMLKDGPGVTAHEAAIAAARAVPADRDQFLTAAASFDAVRYGDASADEAMTRQVVALSERFGVATGVLGAGGRP
ncbi:DUF4129 domain-containing protein [Schaalia suimastitidis]|uniref:DUF4129 domain-containing protein n=1 Tax=Schaalia suimastitidis TaxID=121163 RepID=UPI0004033B22|nr:DUF4129 domain-containing protein [Schaalia suimastitidis]